MRVAVLAALMACIAFMPGCRYSDTLLNVIFDVTGTLEAHADPEYRETEGAPEDPTKASVHLSENENLAQQSNFLPVYKEDATINGTAVRRTYNDQTVDDYDAVEGDQPEDEEDNNTSTSEEDTQDTDSSGEGNDSEQTQVSDNGEGNQADRTSGRGGTGQVYGEGETEDLPDASALAAKGQYALITQMLAGKGGLAAADAAWIADMQSRGAFPNEGIEEIDVVWDSEGNLDLDALIASDADAIIVDGVDVFLTEDQQNAVTQAGINVVTVPHLGETYTQDEDIVSAVKVIGQVLSGLNSDATFATDQMVEKYIEQHDTAINGCLNANGGYSYKYVTGNSYQGIYQGTSSLGEPTNNLANNRMTVSCVDAWTNATQSTVTANRSFGFKDLYLNEKSMDVSDGVGLSACTVGGYFILSDYYMQVAGVVNNAYDTAKPTTFAADSDRTLPYTVIAGSNEGLIAQPAGIRKIPLSAVVFAIGRFVHRPLGNRRRRIVPMFDRAR